MTHTITVPSYITDWKDAAAYIRKRLIDLNIDPDSIYPTDVDDQEVLAIPHAKPLMIEMSFNFDNTKKEKLEPKKSVTMAYQQGFHSSGG